MDYLVWAIVIGTSIWVWIDASQIGARRGLASGILGMGPLGWFLLTILLWIVGFPAYLLMRDRIRAAAQASPQPPGLQPYAAPDPRTAAPNQWPPTAPTYAPPPTPPAPAYPGAAPIPAPAGWHIDPHDPSVLRWWDGVGWSEHTKPRDPD